MHTVKKLIGLAGEAHMDEPIGGWLRVLGALLALAAGVLHLGQIGVHITEGWYVAGFFAATGMAQLGIGLWLLRPRGRAWLWMTIGGSAGLIAVWIVSRTIGLPFVGAGKPEPVGIADAFASLLEAVTVVALGLQLLAERGRLPGLARSAAALGVLGLAIAWQLAASSDMFLGDEARLALDRPQLVDWLVLAFGMGVATSFLVARRVGLGSAIGGLLRGLLASSALVAAVGVVLTLPPTLGQNLDCRYAPLASVTGSGHDQAREAVVIAPGETRLLPVFELRACGREAVGVMDAQPLTVDGHGLEIAGFWLMPRGMRIDEAGIAQPPADALPLPPGGVLEADEERQLMVAVHGASAGELRLGSVRITFTTTAGKASFGFAASVTACSGNGCQTAPEE